MEKSLTARSYEKGFRPVDDYRFLKSVINHFSHPHPLRYTSMIDGLSKACFAHEGPILGCFTYGDPMYKCDCM
ncbi:unnamed protein product [Dovyalis caffra]|uniref:Uncharacterized protein n=1 Tax=Dovyalis caffra TaxID=77055 RepID=A0AAV1RKU0_9ROSI|nr:unnamed protein product [Dovyalis caffra]